MVWHPYLYNVFTLDYNCLGQTHCKGQLSDLYRWLWYQDITVFKIAHNCCRPVWNLHDWCCTKLNWRVLFVLIKWYGFTSLLLAITANQFCYTPNHHCWNLCETFSMFPGSIWHLFLISLYFTMAHFLHWNICSILISKTDTFLSKLLKGKQWLL